MFELTPQESISLIIIILFLTLITMFSYIVYRVVKSEKIRKNYNPKEGDDVYVPTASGGVYANIDKIEGENNT